MDQRWQRRPIPPPLDLPSDQRPTATVSCDLAFEIADRATLALQIAPATTAGRLLDESLTVSLDGRRVDIAEVAVDHGGRIHVVDTTSGELTVHYRGRIQPGPPPPAPTWQERLTYLRHSRYCPSDRLAGFARDEFGVGPDPGTTANRVAAWVFERVTYEAGTSSPRDTAVDTLLGGHGVCRDFAHLTVALCRSLSIPARIVAAYAPGLSPMDFHAVAEVLDGDRWLVLDATRLAPRPSLIRIATGRDAADTAFSSTVDGDAELIGAAVSAVTDGDLALDDHRLPVRLA